MVLGGQPWDLTGTYRHVFDVALPDAAQVADPFHAVRFADNTVDEVRRRVQNDTLGHRGRKDDPLYRVRRLLISAHERLNEHGDSKLRGLLTAGDPQGEVRLAWHAKETLPTPSTRGSNRPSLTMLSVRGARGRRCQRDSSMETWPVSDLPRKPSSVERMRHVDNATRATSVAIAGHGVSSRQLDSGLRWGW